MSSDDGPHTRILLPEDEQQGSAAGRSRPLRSLLITTVVLTLLVLAIAVINHGNDEDPDEGGAGGTARSGEQAADPTAPSGTPPVTTTANGFPKGFDRTEQGAQSAAANYAVALGSDGMYNKDERHQIIEAVYAPELTAAIKGQQDRAFTDRVLDNAGLNAEGEAPEGMTFVSRTVPVGTKVEKYERDGATVSVWCTGLIGMAGSGSLDPVRTDWFTYTFQLRWTGGDWKVVKDTKQKGPAPVDGDVPVAGAEDIAGAVEEYGGFTYAR
ncbi:hypothetical protein AQ490_02370 [Wenjunlia vitaminophila]|uniref:DUF8175 domain-containing protein n=1 Tax=Wenjunlia vitaminophila TaxID=76728 RepID=A0A0T6LY81_WENVI|nr:hypothetical protein [Wenjunlia vitaminophila]KRV51070.1 hypothetical protein AQ490_02370 [Wenjunlia vitaminophila]